MNTNSIPVRRNIYLSYSEWKKLFNVIAGFGFEGRGAVSGFLRRVISCDFIFIEGSVKIQIKNGKEVKQDGKT